MLFRERTGDPIAIIVSLLLGIACIASMSLIALHVMHWRRDQAVRRFIDDRGGHIEGTVPALSMSPTLGFGERIAAVSILDSDFGASDIDALEKLACLHTLILSGCELDSRAFSEFSRLRNLESLYLRETSTNDQNVASLTDLSQLRVLDLSCTEVSDYGIEQLPSLPSLEMLVLTETCVSDEGIERLQKKFPHLAVIVEQDGVRASAPSSSEELERSD